MKNQSIVRAWKDRKYRRSMARQDAPLNPAGISFLTDEELGLVAGSLCGCSLSATCCISDSSMPSECLSDCGDCM